MTKTFTPQHRSLRVMAILILAIGSIVFLGSCQHKNQSVEPTLNPHPKKIYDITVTVEGAPGEFISAEGTHRYAIENETCLPLTSFSGVPAVTYARYEKVRYKRTSPTTFTTRVILDKFIPKNDYGLGLCKWSSNVLSSELNNGINRHSIALSPSSQRQYKRFYFNDFFKLKREEKNKDLTVDGYDIGRVSQTKLSSGKYFFITMTVNEVSL
ncbi:MAG: hypothetical protein ABI644_02945 [Arenimonas sp.]